ncbi:PAS domain-containing protein [Methylocucumis oryzae]|uniref:PAS domain-containing protein n=1 Tax=Methylocucumis oryzae TaxID=1632867 RepID=UPI0009E4F094|nr:PAS domain S-box protein [Methylocucumis oryzae]
MRLNWDCHLALIHLDDQALFISAFEHIRFSHPQPITFEYRMRKYSNDWRWILDHAVPLHDNKGEFCGYIGSAIDITERKQAEAEFRIAAAAFESQEAMVITDTETVILRVNKTFCDTTGYSVEELVGKK